MKIIDRIRGLWTYILGASMLPVTYVLSAPCGLSCAICPLGGSCFFLLIPIVVMGVLVVKSVRSLRERAAGVLRFLRQGTGVVPAVSQE
ncbi:MAG: hypothetical protein LUQ40_07245 [Methanomicrobiales archaeon]|nr:hypothetical protein [Methanomicrobiales archaeon]